MLVCLLCYLRPKHHNQFKFLGSVAGIRQRGDIHFLLHAFLLFDFNHFLNYDHKLLLQGKGWVDLRKKKKKKSHALKTRNGFAAFPCSHYISKVSLQGEHLSSEMGEPPLPPTF